MSSQGSSSPCFPDLEFVMQHITNPSEALYDFDIGLGLNADDFEQSVNMDPLENVDGEEDLLEETCVEEAWQSVIPKQEQFTSSTSTLPCTEMFTGYYDFDFEIEEKSTGRPSFLFSPPLSKIFVNLGAQIPIKFRWEGTRADLKVRALPVFLSPQDFSEPVVRCQIHCTSTHIINTSFSYLDHVVCTDHKGAEYIRDPCSERLSVLVPLLRPQPGSNSVTVLYSLMCKNSCSTGMNRRPTQMIFTLEDVLGQVLGRHTVKFRVCSCPKRDKEKEEKVKSKADKKEEENAMVIPRNDEEANSSQESTSGSLSKQRIQSGSSSSSKRRKLNTSGMVLVPVPTDECLRPVLVTAIGALHAKAEMQGRPLNTKEVELKEKYKTLMREYPQS